MDREERQRMEQPVATHPFRFLVPFCVCTRGPCFNSIQCALDTKWIISVDVKNVCISVQYSLNNNCTAAYIDIISEMAIQGNLWHKTTEHYCMLACLRPSGSPQDAASICLVNAVLYVY